MAYASLLSLSHILEQTLNCDDRYLILDEKQQITSLLEKGRFLQDFLDKSSQQGNERMEYLESQIRDAAYTAADLIESYVRLGVLEESSSHRKKSNVSLRKILRNTFYRKFQENSSATFSHELEKVIGEFDSVKERLQKIEEKSGVEDLQPRNSFPGGSSKLASSGKSGMVGIDDDLREIKNRLTGGSQNLETVPIVGMGGIGKTTLARKLYNDELVIYHFYVRAWVTISHNYDMQRIYRHLLDSMGKLNEKELKMVTEQLEELLYKNLKSMRYLIVLDDVWETKLWDDLKRLFPNDNNGSRIMVTTRIENVARYPNYGSLPHRMRFLDKDESWNLFCGTVFGEESCPSDLEQIGKKIAEKCQGLPLAILVIAGLLSKAAKTQTFWTKVGENLSSVITSNDEQCSKILLLSYKYLPHHLKGCFLYLGIFPEDFSIPVTNLVKLWIAEGLVKSVESKSLEDMAEEYLLDLVDRNLTLVSKKSSKGKVKACMIHDLLRDLCIREAQREMIFHASNKHLRGIPKGIEVRGLSIHSHEKFNLRVRKLYASILPRSLFSRSRSENHMNWLIRVLDTKEFYPEDQKLKVVSLRYLACVLDLELPASIYKFRDLQTLIIYRSFYKIRLEPEIWKMPQLRHVQLKGGFLPDPPSRVMEAGNSLIVLENLQTLSGVQEFRCTKQILRRIPNLKKLGIIYEFVPLDLEFYGLNNLVRLHKLESLNFFFRVCSTSSSFFKKLTFPPSLKKLTLDGSRLPWEDMTNFGSLPNLEVLKLKYKAFDGSEWEPNEGEFLQLKFLLLGDLDLERWRADSIHFPSLRHLVLQPCHNLEEIPSGIGEIPTLQSIELHGCRDCLITSAKEIQEEQLSLGNEDLQVLISQVDLHF